MIGVPCFSSKYSHDGVEASNHEKFARAVATPEVLDGAKAGPNVDLSWFQRNLCSLITTECGNSLRGFRYQAKVAAGMSLYLELNTRLDLRAMSNAHDKGLHAPLSDFPLHQIQLLQQNFPPGQLLVGASGN